MWGKIIIPMYRLWLNSLYGLYGPRCPLSSKRPINLISLSLWTKPDLSSMTSLENYLKEVWLFCDGWEYMCQWNIKCYFFLSSGETWNCEMDPNMLEGVHGIEWMKWMKTLSQFSMQQTYISSCLECTLVSDQEVMAFCHIISIISCQKNKYKK